MKEKTICLKCGPDITYNESSSDNSCWICDTLLVGPNDVPEELKIKWSQEKHANEIIRKKLEREAHREASGKAREEFFGTFFAGLIQLVLVISFFVGIVWVIKQIWIRV